MAPQVMRVMQASVWTQRTIHCLFLFDLIHSRSRVYLNVHTVTPLICTVHTLYGGPMVWYLILHLIPKHNISSQLSKMQPNLYCCWLFLNDHSHWFVVSILTFCQFMIIKCPTQFICSLLENSNKCNFNWSLLPVIGQTYRCILVMY